LVTFYVLFFIDLASRTAKIAGATTNLGDDWMTQIARNLTDPEVGFPRRTRYLIMDRDIKYSDAFRGFTLSRGSPSHPAAAALAESAFS
jgi:putative transposase